MVMARRYRDLLEMSDEELIEQYDAMSQNTVLGLGFLREELWRREMERSQQTANEAAVTTKRLTWVILLLTVVNVAAVAVQVFTATT